MYIFYHQITSYTSGEDPPPMMRANLNIRRNECQTIQWPCTIPFS